MDVSDPSRYLSIGAFSLLSGISITALRHYDELGVLRPAAVDPHTGYRRYRHEQIGRARAVRTLREVDLPLDDIGLLLNADDHDLVTEVLTRHRAALDERAEALDRMLFHIDELIKKGLDMTETMSRTGRVAEITLRVADIDQAAEFYRTVFGVEFEPDSHGDSPVHYHASFGSWPTDNFFLFTLWPSAHEERTTSSLGFVVDDLDGAWERAKAGRAKLVSPPADTGGMPRNARIEDLSGNRIMLYEG